MKIDKKIIKELTEYLNEFNLTEIEYTDKDTKIKVSKSIVTNLSRTSSVEKSTEKNIAENNNKQIGSPNNKKVTSPIIGTAYHASEPGGKKFTEVGKKIKKGDTIMIVEAMKTMNHIPSTLDGVVKEVLVSDGQPVEFGQTLITLE